MRGWGSEGGVPVLPSSISNIGEVLIFTIINYLDKGLCGRGKSL